ncbi:MAG: ABC transporter substrate-binding protein [Planctomycetota bacterium]
MKRLLPLVLFVVAVGGAVWLATRGPVVDVTIYTAVDDALAREILADFEKESGLKLKIVTDTEATKTVGLATRLLQEGAPGRQPRCDVYWNNEPLWTERLAEAGVLEKYDSPAAEGIPESYRDPRGYWTANGLRARVFITHPESLGDLAPKSYLDLAAPAFKDVGALAWPRAGTTLSHMAALRVALGAETMEKWFRSLDGNGVQFASGNGSLAREVGRGQRAFGFTDTDDFVKRKLGGEPVDLVFPDQGEGQLGTYVLPITVSLVRDAPHPDNARVLYDWLVSPKGESAMSATSYATIPVRPDTPGGPNAVSLKDFRAAKVDWTEAFKHIDAVLDLVRSVEAGAGSEDGGSEGE